MSSERDRVISISLTEAEWRAFVACQPRPVDWLRARIFDAVAASSSPREEPRGQPAARAAFAAPRPS
jgi:hypothetical protein